MQISIDFSNKFDSWSKALWSSEIKAVLFSITLLDLEVMLICKEAEANLIIAMRGTQMMEVAEKIALVQS